MLVLSRKKNEVIRIGRDVRLSVVEIRGDKVRLGIDAPEQVQVHREEVARAIERSGINRRQLEQLRTGDHGIAEFGNSIVVYQPSTKPLQRQ